MPYEVIFDDFTKRHFIKTFEKKYKGTWDLTMTILRKEFEQIDLLFQKSAGEIIIKTEKIDICKTEFKIAGTNMSRHTSGNRCIVAVHKNKKVVVVLLIYHKNDVGGGNETALWKNIIRENYHEYKEIL